MSRNWLPLRVAAAFALTLAAVLVADASAADPVTPADAKAFDKLVVDTLRDVHNKGADLYNEKQDYPGAYRLYQGSLLTVRPLLAHHPAAQKFIDDGLAAAEKEPDITRKGFILHETIERVRSELRGIGPKVDDKKGTGLPPPAKADTAKVSGKVTFQGKPVAEGEIAFVPSDPKLGKTATATIKDGSYSVSLVPGRYAVAVTGSKDMPLPAKYAASDTSALTAEVKDGANTLDYDLK